MIDYEIFDAKLDKYLRKQMNVEEETAFKKELFSSPDLLERARTTALMIKQMKEIRAFEDEKIISAINDMDEQDFLNHAGITGKILTRNRRKPWAASILFDEEDEPVCDSKISISSDTSLWKRVVRYAVAACLIGVVCAIGFRMHVSSQYSTLGNSTDYYAYVSELNDIKHLRGDYSQSTVEELISLFNNVKNGKELNATIAKLEVYYTDAVNESSNINEFVDDIAWNLSIAYLKDGNGKKAIPILEQFVKRNKDFPSIVEPVQNLIDKAKDI